MVGASLASLHNAEDEKIFNSVIIVTDRVVLDRQLQETVAQFEQTDGVVQKIDKDTHQLTAALQQMCRLSSRRFKNSLM